MAVGCFYVEIEGLWSRELFLMSLLTIFNVKAQVPVKCIELKWRLWTPLSFPAGKRRPDVVNTAAGKLRLHFGRENPHALNNTACDETKHATFAMYTHFPWGILPLQSHLSLPL